MSEQQTPPNGPPTDGPQSTGGGGANPPRRKLFIGLFVLSLVANLFLAGAVAGHFVGGRDGRQGPPPLMRGPGQLLEGLGGDHRSRALRHLDDRSSELRGYGRELSDARRAVADALVADPFDRDALEQAFATLRSVSETTQEALHAVITEAAVDLPADERGRLLRGIIGRRGDGKRGGDDRRD